VSSEGASEERGERVGDSSTPEALEEWLRVVDALHGGGLARFCRAVGVSSHAVAACALESAPLRPCFAVYVDDAKRAIVVALRGSRHAVDWMTNLGCETVAWSGGGEGESGAWTHEGMLRAAETMIRGAGPVVQRLVLEQPGQVRRVLVLVLVPERVLVRLPEAAQPQPGLPEALVVLREQSVPGLA
jgi:hypothetical protein